MKPEPPYIALAVAHSFALKAHKQSRSLTQIAIKKLVYFAQGWHLACLGTPLIDETLFPGTFGPEFETVEYALRSYGGEFIPLDDPIWGHTPWIPTGDLRSIALIEKVWSEYGGFSDAQIGLAARDELWNLCRAKGWPEMPHDLVRDHFIALKKEEKK